MTETQTNGKRAGIWGVLFRLSSVNFALTATAIITSPILSRTLGPGGRGQVAAVFAVLGVTPWICDFGLNSYLTREHARGDTEIEVLLGSVVPAAIGGGLVATAAAVPLAHLIGQGRPHVVFFLELGLWLTPIAVLGEALSGLVVAEERWNLFLVGRAVSNVGAALIIVLLACLNLLTVTSVSITYVVLAILSVCPYFQVLRGRKRWRFEKRILRAAISFGAGSWLTNVALLSNAQLDQVIMAGVVSSRQLGLYALAATISTVCNSLFGAIVTALAPRLARGDFALAAKAGRISVAVAVAFGLPVGVASPWILPLIFGGGFSGAVPMLAILLGANVFGTYGNVVGSTLVSLGLPKVAARAQTLALVVTVPGLIVALPIAGGIGAAAVSLVAYLVSALAILWSMSRVTELPVRSHLFLQADDLQVLTSLRRSLLSRAS